MATLKDKLSALGRGVRELTLMSRDGSESVTVFYQRPTSIKDRMLRESMKEEFDKAVVDFFTVTPDGKSKHQLLIEQFTRLGSEKLSRFIVLKDVKAIRAMSIRELGEEEPPTTADQAIKDEYFERLKPVFQANIDQSIAELAKEPLDVLAESATESEKQDVARERAFKIYSKHLIMDSILEEVEENGTKVPGRYTQVFKTVAEIEEYLPEESIDDLAEMINEEVRKAREAPLKSVATS